MNSQLLEKTKLIAVFFLLIIGLILAVSPVYAAEEIIKLLPHWKKGEKIHFEKVKSRQRMQEDKVTLKSTNRTDLGIEVLSVSDRNYVLAFTYGEARFDDPTQAENPIVKKITNLFKGYQIILELDSNAKILGVQNWKELKEMSTKLLDTLSGEMKSAGLDQATVSRICTQVASMYATKQQIDQFYTQEAQLLFFALGVEFKNDKPFQFEDSLPSPLGGEPIPSRASFTLKEVDKNIGVAKVMFTQTIDSENAKRVVNKALKDLSQNISKPAPDSEMIKSLTIEDSAEFNFAISSGWVQFLKHRRFYRIDNASQEDIITITRKKD